METVGGSEPMVLPMEAKSRGCFAVISSCAARTRNVFRNYSLACRAGCFTSLLVSLGIFASHGLFLWAQWGGANHDCILGTEATHCSGTHMQPGLLKGEIVSHVDFEAGNLLSLLTTLVEGKLCPGPQMLERCPDGEHTQITDLKSVDDIVCTALECGGVSLDIVLLTMSYQYTWHELYWKRKGTLVTKAPLPPLCVYDHARGAYYSPFEPQNFMYCNDLLFTYPGRVSGLCIFAFSFIWPHVKLVLMHLLFYLPTPILMRRNGNYWLAFFGKWSLTDVLVCCLVIGLFDLSIDMSLQDYWADLGDAVVGFCKSECMQIPVGNATLANTTCLSACELVAGEVEKVSAIVAKARARTQRLVAPRCASLRTRCALTPRHIIHARQLRTSAVRASALAR